MGYSPRPNWTSLVRHCEQTLQPTHWAKCRHRNQQNITLFGCFHHCLQRCFRQQKRWIMCILYTYIYIYTYTYVLYKLYEDPWPICNQRNRVSRIRLFFSIITHGRFETQALKYAEDERKPSTNKWRNQFVNYKERKEENICRQIRNKENIQIEKQVSK